jgi:poly(3-hydroxybutyrate) depolymerase
MDALSDPAYRLTPKVLTPSLLHDGSGATVYPAPRPPPTNPLFSSDRAQTGGVQPHPTAATRETPAPGKKGHEEIDAAAAAADEAPPAAGALSGLLTAKDGLKYMVYLPKSWSAVPMAESESPKLHPLLLFLHGRGGVKNSENVRGQSITKMLRENDPNLMATDADGFPFIVLIPVASQPGWQPQFPSLLSLVATAQSDLHADPARTYLTGQSMGGNGAWHLAASAAAGVFTAVVPVCGYLEMGAPPPKTKRKNSQSSDTQPQQQPAVPAPDRYVVNALLHKSIPIWAFHSADDAVVPVGHTDVAIEALRQQQYDARFLRYTRYETAPPMVLSGGKEMAGHAAWELAYSTTELCASHHTAKSLLALVFSCMHLTYHFGSTRCR